MGSPVIPLWLDSPDKRVRIQYRRGDEEHLQVEIAPDKLRDPVEKQMLSEARFVNRDLQQLPAMIKEAEQKLGLGTNQGFARDQLQVQITSRTHQPLTLVDLPGLIESHSRGSEHIKYVKSIVDSWITQDRSIILAVVEASSDPQRQAILTRAKEEDPDGSRTFGIITKPDAVEHGSDLERYWIDHARNIPNGRVEFGLKKGWHVLRNRTYGERQVSSDRDAIERQFFLDPNRNWSAINQRYWGVDQLQARLRTLLYEETKKQLPKVRKDIATKLENYTKELRSLKDRLQRPDKLWTDYNNECKELAVTAKTGVDGKHNHPFFADETEPSRDLRARVEELYDNFREGMVTDSHGRQLSGDESALSRSNEPYIAEVEKLLQTTKGEELPGLVDPQRLNLIFWKHSVHWRGHAQALIDQAHSHCLAFVGQMINVYFSEKLPGIPQAIFHIMVAYLEDSLENQKDQAREELAKLEADRGRSVKTRNSTFAERSAQKAMASVMRAKASEDQASNGDYAAWATPMAFPISSKRGISHQIAEKLANDMLIYYEVRRHPMMPHFDCITLLTTFVTDRPKCLYRQCNCPSYRASSPCAPSHFIPQRLRNHAD